MTESATKPLQEGQVSVQDKPEPKLTVSVKPESVAPDSKTVAVADESLKNPKTGGPLCVVFDLNGTLVTYRRDVALDAEDKEHKREIENDEAQKRSHVWRGHSLRFRPHLDTLMKFLFEEAKCRVACWTFSGREKHAKDLMRATFGKWADRIEFTYDGGDVPASTKAKDLNVIWKRHPEWATGRTILVDDSPKKAVRQPKHALIVETYHFEHVGDTALLDVLHTLRTLAAKPATETVETFSLQETYLARRKQRDKRCVAQ